MNKWSMSFIVGVMVFLCQGCATTMSKVKTAGATAEFLRVDGSHFSRSNKPYYIAGTNMWYAGYLGAPTAVGDRARLVRELDALKAMHINNVRVLAVSEKSVTGSTVKPAIVNGFGNYDEELLQGLDYLLVELAKRDITVVLYLNNFWQWSGGMTQYMNWIDGEPVQDPNVTGDYEGFMKKSASFYSNARAQQEYRNIVQKIVTRKNSLTGMPYINDPIIASWQLANEPRPGNKLASDSEKNVYLKWINDTATYIHSLDPNHLVSTGSEGLAGSVYDEKLFVKAHSLPSIDYVTYHLWIRNWGWIDRHNMASTWDHGLMKARDYLNLHIDLANTIKKPIVLEEFGLDRDSGAFDRLATTHYRDRYYGEVFALLLKRMQAGEAIAGFNFWAWNGSARTQRPNYWWQQGDDFMGDPPQEEQGMYGIFDSDRSTIDIIKHYSQEVNKLN